VSEGVSFERWPLVDFFLSFLFFGGGAGSRLLYLCSHVARAVNAFLKCMF